MTIRTSILPLATIAMLTACAATPNALAESTPIRTITVTGQGEAVAAPDMALLNIGVRTDAQTAAAALRQNSQNMAATINKLKDLGIEDRDIQTSGLSINPRYDYERNRSAPKLIGYTASNNLSVKLRDLAKAGSVIDQAVQSGANTIGGISFTFADPSPLYEAAREDAVKRAKAKADLLTEAAGVKLGKVMTIQDGYGPAPSPFVPVMESSMKFDAAVPVQAGESTISANVTIIYEIN